MKSENFQVEICKTFCALILLPGFPVEGFDPEPLWKLRCGRWKLTSALFHACSLTTMHDIDIYIYFYEYQIYINTWGPMTSIFLFVNPPKPRPKFQSKQPGHLMGSR